MSKRNTNEAPSTPSTSLQTASGTKSSASPAERASYPVSTRNLDFDYVKSDGITTFRALTDVTFDLPQGSRCVVIAPNGAGKSTLLRVLAGRHLTLDPNSAWVLGGPSFYQTIGVSGVSYLGNHMWQRSVAFVGTNVPFEADIAARDMLADLQTEYRERRDELVRVLDIDLSWRMNALSDGQRRRVQIMLGLLRPFKLLLMDEVSVDLDALTRHDLMEYLGKETRERGSTIVYVTHIFDGLDAWPPTHIMLMGQGNVLSVLPPLANGQTLYQIAMEFLKQQRLEARASGAHEEALGTVAEAAEPFGQASRGYGDGRLAKSRMDAYR